ncbi:NUDIX domain-containing protein [Butyrivibrio sp. AE3004]|uniref:NUDIX domain-containing protein n=1 Tax=Butyrivibrio sp. AE3004 TaxID=1506994 RepID=UPI0009E0A4A8|nr:NUDIX domain-containing protein [Butyrivibrio sp. AE3004]
MTLSAKKWGCDHFMEYIDIYTRDGIPTGKIKEKHEAKLPGEYYRHVLIIMKTVDSPMPGEGEGMYIVQQRSLKTRYYAGKWDMTGGGVRSGEAPDQAAIRELSEELGIVVNPQDMKLAFDYIKDWDDGTGLLASVFMIRVEIPKGGFSFNHYEVNDVKIMPFHEFYTHVMDHNDEEMGRGLKEIEQTL